MPDLAADMPSSLRRQARWTTLGPTRAPAMLVHPSWNDGDRVPLVVWMHGRTVSKEIDPGRHLRLLRAGLGVCAVDLPGHGERLDAELQRPERTFDVVRAMHDEIDGIVEAALAAAAFDPARLAIGGMSAGGMAALARLAAPHRFVCAAVEATTGSWRHQARRAMFRDRPAEEIDALDPIGRLEAWREIPLQAIHARHDEWVGYDGQAAFIEALRGRYDDPALVELVTYDRTGAPYEHAGFGRMASDAKNRQRDFLARWLAPAPPG